MESAGLRERKKRRTRETIARVAMELFARQGYVETTITEIAAAADVSPRTVSGYFPAKEDLVFPEQEESLASLARRLRERDAEEVAPEALRDWLEERMLAWRGHQDMLRRQHAVVASNEVLQAHHQLFIARARAMLGVAIADDIGAAPDDLEPRMAAASTTAIIELLSDYVAPRSKDAAADVDIEAIQEEVLSHFDRAVVFVAAGIRALRESKPG